MHEQERKKYEDRIQGKKIVGILWSDRPLFGRIDVNQIAGLELEGGEVISFNASGQIDVDVVWLELEDE
jgi:hypothetical protein